MYILNRNHFTFRFKMEINCNFTKIRDQCDLVEMENQTLHKT